MQIIEISIYKQIKFSEKNMTRTSNPQKPEPNDVGFQAIKPLDLGAILVSPGTITSKGAKRGRF